MKLITGYEITKLFILDKINFIIIIIMKLCILDEFK